MIFQKNKFFGLFFAYLVCCSFFLFHNTAIASSTDGTVDSVYKYAWGENIGWINFGADNGNVHITDSGLSGYALSETAGWINLDGVENDGQGNLSGYAWGENVGYIKFDPPNGGVSIGQNGEFSGSALGENVGWIIFEGDYSPKTDWRPASAREEDGEEDLEIYRLKTEKTSGSITLRWRTNRKSDSEVKWGIDKNLTNKEKESKNEKTHKIVVKGLLSGTTYYFRVRSEDEDGVSDRTRIFSVKTDPAPKKPASGGIFQKKIQEQEEPEEIEFEVSDAPQESEEPVVSESQLEQVSEVQEEKERKPSFFASIGTFFSDAFSFAASSVKSTVISAQKRILFLVERMWGKEQKTYFTTEIFPRDGIKTLAEVKFQLITPNNTPIANTQATLSSEPQTNTTDEDGIVSFKDISIGDHTLAFSYEGNDFRKKIAIKDTFTDSGVVRAEIIRVVAGFDCVALWMWVAIVVLIGSTLFFAIKYFLLKKRMKE